MKAHKKSKTTHQKAPFGGFLVGGGRLIRFGEIGIFSENLLVLKRAIFCGFWEEWQSGLSHRS